MNHQKFPVIVTQASELFLCDSLDKLWIAFMPCCISCMFLIIVKLYVNFIFLVQLNYTLKWTNKKFRQLGVIHYNFYVCPCTKTFCLIFIRSFRWHLYMIQIQNTKFEVSAVICFWVILITDTQGQTAKNAIFRFRGLQIV